MAIFNNRPTTDVRKVMTGKDGGLFTAGGELMANIESFQAQASLTNTKYRPLGFMQELSKPDAYNVTLTFTQFVIADDYLIRALFDFMKSGVFEPMVFQGVLQSGYNGSEERVIYRDCVPDGSVDLQNLTVGDLVKRAWNWAVNQPPDLQSLLTDN